jgi:hypothetical protein
MTTTKPKLITHDEMMDMYFVCPDTSLEAYYHSYYPDEDVDYEQFLFYYSNSMNGISNADYVSWGESLEDEAIEEARDLALRDGHQIIGDDLGFTDGYYIDPGKAESEILIVEDWNDFSTWIEFVIEELEKEEKRRQIWNEIRDRHSELEFKSDESEYNDEFEAMGEFAEAMKEMGDDTSTTFFDHFVLVDDEDNRTEYTAGELRDIAKRMGIKL